MHEKDLAIIIKSECVFYQDWMTFASWYSIYKNISDAQIFIKLKRDRNLFKWIDKLNVKLYKSHIKIDRPIIKEIDASVMAVRSLNDDLTDKLSICSTKSDIDGIFVDYKFGCGKFVLDEWIGKKKAPFRAALKNFSEINMTINEYAILNIWENCFYAYQAIGGSV